MSISRAALWATCISIVFLFPSIAMGQESSSEEANAEPIAASTTPDTVQVRDVADDSAIVDRLQNILQSSGWFRDVEVSSESGFVTISGVTSSDEHREWATSIASRTEDVIGVRNDISVESVVNFRQSLGVVTKSLQKLYRDFLLRVPFLVAGLIVILLTWLAARLTTAILSRVLSNQQRLRSSLRDLIRQLVTIGIWVIGLLIATVVVFPGMTPAKALTVLGLGSVAIGFAFKDIFENFFAGVLILWRYPFDTGDFISYGDASGRVERITIRNTMIRRTDGELVVVPNGLLFKTDVEVLTDRSLRRVRITCGVGYGEDVDQSREVIHKAVRQCESVDKQKDVQVFANEFADSSVNFEVAWWTGATPLEIRASRDEVIASVKRALDNAEIEIPFPYRTLTFADAGIEASLADGFNRNGTSAERN